MLLRLDGAERPCCLLHSGESSFQLGVPKLVCFRLGELLVLARGRRPRALPRPDPSLGGFSRVPLFTPDGGGPQVGDHHGLPKPLLDLADLVRDLAGGGAPCRERQRVGGREAWQVKVDSQGDVRNFRKEILPRGYTLL